MFEARKEQPGDQISAFPVFDGQNHTLSHVRKHVFPILFFKTPREMRLHLNFFHVAREVKWPVQQMICMHGDVRHVLSNPFQEFFSG